MEEIWKDIIGYEGLYQISSLGRVRSLDKTIITKHGHKRTFKGQIIKPNISAGYYSVNLHHKGKAKTIRIHRLLAIAFLEGYKPGLVVNHKDENPLNNDLSNLEWCTQKYNVTYGTSKSKQIETLEKNGHLRPVVLNGVKYRSTSEARKKNHLDGRDLYRKIEK